MLLTSAKKYNSEQERTRYIYDAVVLDAYKKTAPMLPGAVFTSSDLL